MDTSGAANIVKKNLASVNLFSVNTSLAKTMMLNLGVNDTVSRHQIGDNFNSNVNEVAIIETMISADARILPQSAYHA